MVYNTTTFNIIADRPSRRVAIDAMLGKHVLDSLVRSSKAEESESERMSAQLGSRAPPENPPVYLNLAF